MANVQSFPSQCGMRIITDLDEGNIYTQIAYLKDALVNSCQAVLTDRVGRKKRWGETKILAFKGPIRRNPNTSAGVQVYICTKETLRALERYAEDKTGKGKKKINITKYIPKY